MFLRARNSRSLTVLALAAALLGGTAGCGADLGKANFPRSTVPAAPAGSTAPVDTKAYDVSVLRVLDPCSLLDKASLTPLGAPGDPVASSTTFDDCRNTVKDAGGKDVKVSVQVGALVSGVDSGATGTVEGLPQVVFKTDDTYCTVSAVTATKPINLGISYQVTYKGGDACQAGRALLAPALKKIRDAPVKYPDAKGTLLTLDPCTTIDDAAVAALMPSPKLTRVRIHECQWDGGGATLTTSFRKGLTPIEGDGYTKVDLDGVHAFKKPGTSSASQCTVQWQQRPWQDDDVEIAQFVYVNRDANKETDDPCGKAVTLARTVAAKLPKA